MNSIIIIILVIALVVSVGIIVFLVLNNKKMAQNSNTSTPMAAPVPPQVTQNSGTPVQADIPPQRDHVAVAKNLMGQQRYDDAITELKQGLNAQPQNSNIMLTLLNAYALTKQHNEFSQLFQRVQAQGDMTTLQQAQNIKSMLDAESAAVQPQQPVTQQAPAAEPVADSLDFSFDEMNFDDNDAANIQAVESETAPVGGDDSGLAFDDIENQLYDDSQQNTATEDDFDLNFSSEDAPSDEFDLSFDTPEQETEPTLDAGEFDLSFDDIDDTTVEQPQAASVVESNESDINGLDFDLSFDEPTNEELTYDAPVEEAIELETNEATTVEPTIEDNEFDFSWDETDDSTPVASEDTNLDFTDSTFEDNTFEENSFENDTLEQNVFDDASVPAEPSTNETEALDFDFGIEEDTSASVSQASVVEPEAATTNAPATDEFDFDLSDDLSFDTDTIDTSSVQEAAASQQTTQDSIDSLDFSLDDDFSSDAAATQVSETALDDSQSFELDDFNISDTTTSEPQRSVPQQEQALSVDTPSSSQDTSEPVLSSGLEDTLSQLDAMNFDDPSTTNDSDNDLADFGLETETPAAPTPAVAPTPTVASPVQQPAPATSTTPAPSQGLTGTGTSSEFDQSFDFVKGLDKAQITLDLAQQYLDLGEYDSAKRLVTEVLHSDGSGEQKRQAQALLARIN